MTALAEKVTFRVPGLPAPKGSRTVGHRRDGTAYTRSAAGGEQSWTEAVALVARSHRPAGGPLPPAYSVGLAFALPRPERPSHPHPTRADLDKLIRAVLDGLTRGGLIVDDRLVVSLVAAKRWADRPGEEGVAVTVQPVPRDDRVNETCREDW